LKFKTKKELEDSIEWIDCDGPANDWNGGYQSGIADAFDSFKERIDFFSKYKLNSGNITPHFLQEAWNEYKGTNNWNNWLFDYCFGDVIE